MVTWSSPWDRQWKGPEKTNQWQPVLAPPEFLVTMTMGSAESAKGFEWVRKLGFECVEKVQVGSSMVYPPHCSQYKRSNNISFWKNWCWVFSSNIGFPKSDVNKPMLTSVIQKTNVNKLLLTSVFEKSTLTGSSYLRVCHRIFVNIGFLYNQS